MRLPSARRSRQVLSGAFVLAALASSLAFVGCARSDQSIQNEYDDFLAGATDCADASECVLVYPGCPLGCYAVVNTSNKSAAEAKATDLIDQYQLGGRSCQYDCTAPGEVTCNQGHCEVAPLL